MHADAYLRARKLISHGPRTLALARLLGTLQSLLILALLAVGGLLVSLLASQGEARLPVSQLESLPSWVQARATGIDQGVRVFDDSGLFPLVAGNLSSPNGLHRRGAALLLRTIRVVPTL